MRSTPDRKNARAEGWFAGRVPGVGMTPPAVLEEIGPETLVRAGGGLVLRTDRQGECLVAVVHRPGREDWTFPKGKVEPGERLDQCALREVFEETGLVCRLGRVVGHVDYRDRKNRPKIVTYWTMEPVEGDFTPNDEVDELCWLTFDEAAGRLSYDRDRELLRKLDGSLVA